MNDNTSRLVGTLLVLSLVAGLFLWCMWLRRADATEVDGEGFHVFPTPAVLNDMADLIAYVEWVTAAEYAAAQQEAARREAEAQRLAEPPRPPSQPSTSVAAFLACTRRHESDSAGGYRAVSPSGTYRGAYQFHQNTWNTVAGWIRPDLIGVRPDQASPADQDQLAAELYRRRGNAPWGGRC